MATGWVSGLSYKHVLDARQRAANAAWLGYKHRDAIHYTQSAARWNGINHKLVAARGQFPDYADCSAFATWCLWNGLYIPYGVRDTVNGSGWCAGYTGTMLQHGRVKTRLKDVRKGDCVIYGRKGTTGAHTAIVVGWNKRPSQGGHPMVISHGSEGGPYYLAYNYRSDIMSIRRYI
jgi:hypothetical protein